MGFKRTTEGRVFFQNLDEGSAAAESQNSINRAAERPLANGGRPVLPAKQDATQAQIVALLKSLNTRLQSTQNDREKLQQELETYKMMVLSLQEKTDKQEREAAQIRKTLSEAQENAGAGKKAEEAQQLSREAIKEFEEARRLILEIEERAERAESQLKKQQVQIRQSEEQVRVKFEQFEQKQQKQSQDILARMGVQDERQKLLDSRVEDSINATLKIERKIDKAIQERARLIRKLERIEETVLQTNEAMNSRAMILLTDQALAAQAGFDQRPAISLDGSDQQGATAQGYDRPEYDAPVWKKSFKMQAASVSMIVLVAALLGWGLSEMQKPEALSLAELVSSAPSALSGNTQEKNIADLDMTEPFKSAQQDFSQETALSGDAAAAFDQMIEQSQPTSNAQYDVSGASVERLNNDIGAIDLNDEQQVLDLLEKDPDALAAQLNAIEPSSIPQGQEFAAATAGQAAPLSMTESAPDNADASVAGAKTVLAPVSLSTPEARAALGLDKIELPSTLNGELSARIRHDQSLPDTIKTVEKSAFDGDASAQHDLAAIYTAGHAGVKQDYKRAAQWFEEAAHNGVANARYNLGVLYHQGIGVKQDTEKAFQWYKTAAALDHPEAQYNLGIAYIEGIGVAYDPLKAATFFESAANGGVTEAAYNLGLIYENGLLGKTQPDTALFWYKRAADKGSPEARAALEQLAKTLGMAVSDVNKMIDGMNVAAGMPTAEKKTEKTAELENKAPVSKASTPKSNASQEQTRQDQHHILIARVQESLMDMGLYPGPVDGVGGAMTRDAVRTYQSRHDLSDDGEITASLLTHMREMGYILEGENNEQGSRE